MGQCETLCDKNEQDQIPPVYKNQLPKKELNKIIEAILQNRQELNQSPRVPQPIKKKIERLQQIDYEQRYEQYKRQTKIWRVKSPIHFCYINKAEFADDEPTELCIIYLYKEKGEFAGYFHGNRQTLKSIYILPNGSYFIGDSVKDNYGLFINESTNYKYEGQWCDNQPHGTGKQETPKGQFEGTFNKGVKEGVGKFTFPNKDLVYEGDFKNDQINGKGKLYSYHGKYEYVGEFLKGEKHGLGIQKFEGTLYQGYFRHNEKSGRGKIIFESEGVQYEGEFYHNQPHGKGEMRKKKETITGVWQQGQLKVVLKIN